MSRKRVEKKLVLDTGTIVKVSGADIKVILRGADDLIAIGGRSMLTKVLKGSKDQKLLKHDLQKNPSYGYYQTLTIKEIGYRVDWVIENGYLRIEYQGDFPMLVYTDRGWEIEKETYALELFQRVREAINNQKNQVIFELIDGNRQVILRLLEKIEATNDPRLLPFLATWKLGEVRKVKNRISEVEKNLAK